MISYHNYSSQYRQISLHTHQRTTYPLLFPHNWHVSLYTQPNNTHYVAGFAKHELIYSPVHQLETFCALPQTCYDFPLEFRSHFEKLNGNFPQNDNTTFLGPTALIISLDGLVNIFYGIYTSYNTKLIIKLQESTDRKKNTPTEAHMVAWKKLPSRRQYTKKDDVGQSSSSNVAKLYDQQRDLRKKTLPNWCY